jgi:hypothetical protein
MTATRTPRLAQLILHPGRGEDGPCIAARLLHRVNSAPLAALAFVACSEDDGPTPACPQGAELVVIEPAAPAERSVEGTTVLACERAGQRVGRHVEHYAGSAVAAEGHWRDGIRDGSFTVWDPSGAFQSAETWEQGKRRGARRVVSHDGRILEAQEEGGVMVELRTLPLGTLVDEWVDGVRSPGTSYALQGAGRAEAEEPAR